MNPEDLNEINSVGQTHKGHIESLEAEYDRHKAQYNDFQAKRENSKLTASNVRRCMAWTVLSIKTDTDMLDKRTEELLSGDFSADKQLAYSTTDGAVKWEHIHKWLTSDIPERVVNYLENGRIHDAHALLAGRDPETGEQTTTMYLRTCKASLVLYFLGYNRVCMDTRVYRSLTPQIRNLTNPRKVTHPDTEMHNPYRDSSPRMGASKVSVWSHSGDPNHEEGKTYWEDKLKWNPPQYHAMTQYIVSRIAEDSRIPAELVPQVAFNTEGTATWHSDLMNKIQD
jgi:hypothetical protein